MPHEIPLGDDVFNVERSLWDDEDEGRDDDLLPETETQEERQRRRERDAEAWARLQADIADLEATIDDRLRHGATEQSVGADRARLNALRQEEDNAEYDEYEDEPLLVEAPKPRTAPDFDPAAAFQVALEAELTPDELAHWRLYYQQARSADIATALGVSQGAVSKREPKLVAKVDAIHVRHFGHSYPAQVTDRAQWGRPGRRRKAQE